MKSELIKLFKKHKHLKVNNIPKLSTTEYKDGWGYAYDVYYEQYNSIRVSQRKIFYYYTGFSSVLPTKEYELTPKEYEELTFDLPRRYKRLKRLQTS